MTSFILALRAAVVPKLAILGISPLTSFILALRRVLLAKSVISGILSSIFFIVALYSVFLTASSLTTLLSLLKSTGVVYNLPISNLSTLDFKLAKSTNLVNFDVSTPVAFFKYDFVA